MSKTTIYKIDKEERKEDFTSLIVGIFVYAVVLFISSNVFSSFYLENFLWALMGALIISCLNYTIKPILIYLTLPLSILTLGIAYPLVNMIILKICDAFLGDKFVITGFFSLFFLAIFISLLKIIFDIFINKMIGGKK